MSRSAHEELGQAIANVLDGHAYRYERRDFDQDRGNGPWFEFELGTREPDRLSVVLTLYETDFHIEANRAVCRVEVEGFPDEEAFAEGVLQATRALLSQEVLRIRERSTWLGRGRGTGAVLLGEHWSGDLSCVRGRGRETVFRDWLGEAATT